ncbi:MAG: hypothetical protein ABJG26_11965 [Marinomonas sp.]
MVAFRQHTRAGLTSAGGTFANLLIVLIRNKLLALALGPAGIGWMALVTSLIETATIASASGSSDALNRELARKNAQNSPADIGSTCAGLFACLLALAIPAAALAYLAIVPQRIGVLVALLAIAIALLAAGLWRFLAGVFLGLGLAKPLAKALVAGSAANLAITALLLWQGVREPMVFVVLSPLLLALSGVIAIGARTIRLISWSSLTQMPAVKPVLAIALPITLGLLLEPLIGFYLRSAAVAEFGAQGVGLIQPGLQLALFAGIFFNSVAGITIVRWVQLEERAWSQNYRKLLAATLAIPIVAGALAFACAPIYPFVVELLFAKNFLPGAATVAWFLLGESLRIGGALLLFTFMSRRLGMITLMPRIGALAGAVFFVQMAGTLSLMTIAQAYAAAFACYYALSLGIWLALQYKLSVDEA